MNLYEQITLQDKGIKLTEYRFDNKEKLHADHIVIETAAGMVVDDWIAGSLVLAILSEIDPMKKLVYTQKLFQRCATQSSLIIMNNSKK